jgi:hypothetical protein
LVTTHSPEEYADISFLFLQDNQYLNKKAEEVGQKQRITVIQKEKKQSPNL